MSFSFKKLYDGIVLLSLGLIFLLITLGLVDWGIWLFYLNFWPILLIFFGFRLLASIKKGYEKFVIIMQIIAWIVIIFGGFAYYKVNGNFKGLNLKFAQAIETDNMMRVLSYDYQVKLATGDLRVTDSISTDNRIVIISGEYSDIIGKPVLKSVIDGAFTTVTLENEKNSTFWYPFANYKNSISMDIHNQNNLNLNTDIGAGKIDIKLAKYSYQNIGVNVGAGEISISLTDNAQVASIVASVGTGKITISLPKDYAYILDYSVGAGSVIIGQSESGGVGTNGKRVKSTNYNDADKKVDINASSGLGQIIVEYSGN